jgi:hypothetical protein
MEAVARPQPQLSEQDWALVLELLEREMKQLPAEIHHSSTSAMKETLRRRFDLVDQLLERLRPLARE